MHFLPELKAVANFGYELAEDLCNTDANYLNGISGSGTIIPMKIHSSRDNK
jgi:iron complex outermembrane receptor protein